MCSPWTPTLQVCYFHWKHVGGKEEGETELSGSSQQGTCAGGRGGHGHVHQWMAGEHAPLPGNGSPAWKWQHQPSRRRLRGDACLPPCPPSSPPYLHTGHVREGPIALWASSSRGRNGQGAARLSENRSPSKSGADRGIHGKQEAGKQLGRFPGSHLPSCMWWNQKELVFHLFQDSSLPPHPSF